MDLEAYRKDFRNEDADQEARFTAKLAHDMLIIGLAAFMKSVEESKDQGS